MATITEVQLQDGTVHQLGGGGSNTYTLTKSGSTITLTGSGGDTSSVTDADTTYTFSLSGNVLTITPSSGSPQTITLPDDDTTYTLSASGDTITLTGSDGSTSSVTVTDTDTTYALSKSGSTITLTGSDGTTSSVTDANTTYTFTLSENDLVITPSSGSIQVIPLPVSPNTTYTISAVDDRIILTDSDGYSQYVTWPSPIFLAEQGSTSFDDISDAYNYGKVVYFQYWENVSTLKLVPLAEFESSDHATFMRIDYDGTDASIIIASVDDNDLWSLNRIPLSDSDTTYTISISGNVLTLMPSVGSPQTVTLPTGQPRNIWYGTSPTSASTQAKVASTVDGDFVLATGNMVRIKFANAQTYNGTATLNVDGTGAKNIYRGDSATTRYYWVAGEVVDFVYNGSHYVMANKGTATTTYYGVTKLSSDINSTSTSLAATPSAVKQAYDLADSKQDELVSGTNIKTINGVSVLGSGDIATPDDDTTYTLSISGNTITLTGSDGSTSTANVPDDDTTYTLSISGNTLTLTPSSGSAQTITLPIPTATSDLTNDSGFITSASVPDPTTTTPIMDGVADVGSETDYARGDHVHPSDTSKQNTLVSGTNIKTINGNSLLGSGDITISGGGGSGTSIPTADTVAEFDNDAHMNSTDMTDQEVEDFVDGLNVSGGILGDFVVEQGTNYRKWNSGTLEQWGQVTTGASNGNVQVDITFSVPFIDTNYYIQLTSSRNATASGFLAECSYSSGNRNATTTKTTVSWLKSGNPYATEIKYFVIGRWK